MLSRANAIAAPGSVGGVTGGAPTWDQVRELARGSRLELRRRARSRPPKRKNGCLTDVGVATETMPKKVFFKSTGRTVTFHRSRKHCARGRGRRGRGLALAGMM